jgi:hypothetical protein
MRLAQRSAAVMLVTFLGLAGCGEADLKGAPNVKGLDLPTAKAQLKHAGWRPSVTSDAMFGVLVEENFTVCDEKTPNGKLVPLKVSKSC